MEHEAAGVLDRFRGVGVGEVAQVVVRHVYGEPVAVVRPGQPPGDGPRHEDPAELEPQVAVGAGHTMVVQHPPRQLRRIGVTSARALAHAASVPPSAGGHVTVVEGDITLQRVDAIVNAANSSLLGGGVVDGAIHSAAGPQLLEERRALRASTLSEGLPTGDAVATGAGRLAAKHVVHTVGPVHGAGGPRAAALLLHPGPAGRR